MRIDALTVCVDYSDYLAVGLPRWVPGFASWTIVTTPRDESTIELASRHGLRVHQTEVFYAHGAAFNKGAAMEEARRSMPWEDWICFLDADVVPPQDWNQRLSKTRVKVGLLYYCRRYQASDESDIDNERSNSIHGDGMGVGFFQLFHSGDNIVLSSKQPLIETHWLHAGNYDNAFMNKWPIHWRRELPFRVAHLGTRDNWFGRGQREAFAKMMVERRLRGGWQHERIEKDC